MEKITETSILSWVCIKQKKKETVNVVWNTWECVAGRDMKAAARSTNVKGVAAHELPKIALMKWQRPGLSRDNDTKQL